MVTYSPTGIDVAPGLFIDANQDVAVTITNDFTGVDVKAAEVTVTPAVPVAVAPAFTG